MPPWHVVPASRGASAARPAVPVATALVGQPAALQPRAAAAAAAAAASGARRLARAPSLRELAGRRAKPAQRVAQHSRPPLRLRGRAAPGERQVRWWVGGWHPCSECPACSRAASRTLKHQNSNSGFQTSGRSLREVSTFLNSNFQLLNTCASLTERSRSPSICGDRELS